MNPPPSDSTMLSVVIRMVVPMRREFGRSLDVQQFMHDEAYAQNVLEQALASRDDRLRQYAQQVQQHLLGPRAATSPPLAKAAAPAAPAATGAIAASAAAPTPAPAAATVDATETELRARMLRRYTSGLR